MKHPKNISIEDFSYELPAEKIAVYPLAQRDASKLLIYKNGEISEDKFKSLVSHLEPNSFLVFNTTKVVNARLHFKNENGQDIEIFCLEPSEQGLELTKAMTTQKKVQWNCLVGNLKRWKQEDLQLESKGLKLFVKLLERKEGFVKVEFYWEPADLHFSEVLEKVGNTPIPPYLKRESELSDQSRYQTIYAKTGGSVAAPTAGLHFTGQVFEELNKKGIITESVNLHVGAGTFKPVKAERMQDHEMHAEWIEVSKQSLETLQTHMARSIIAVGTTSLRTLESLYWMGVKAHLKPSASLKELEIRQWEVYEMELQNLSKAESLGALLSWMQKRNFDRLICQTQILIAPLYQLKFVDGIITNFHQPQSTLLLLIGAIVGERWRSIYDYALSHDFRFLSYGDSSLLLK